jgi:hypothetical protein
MVYEKGVVVIDALPSCVQYILKAICEVTDEHITHLVYSHSHSSAKSSGRRNWRHMMFLSGINAIRSSKVCRLTKLAEG